MNYKKFFSKKFWLSAIFFLGIGAVYFSSPQTTPLSDSIWSIHIASSIIHQGNTDLDEYKELIAQRNYFMVDRPEGEHLHSGFPLGTPLLAVPIVFVIEKIVQPFLSFDLYEHIRQTQDDVVISMELFVASFIAVLACGFIYAIALLTLSRTRALFVVLLFAFCTPMWSTASRALWQHGPSVLMLSIALYLLLLARYKPWIAQFVSLPLAYAYVVRPTNSISILLFTLFILVRYRPIFLRYLFWASLIAIPFFAFNFSHYHHLLSPYYLPQRIGNNPTFLEALAGNLISPARGLWVYSPIFLLSFYGIYLKWKKSQLTGLDIVLIAIIFLHWIAISSFPHWWGGHSFGPRFFTDMIPFLTYFLIPVVTEFSWNADLWRKNLCSLGFSILISISFFIHYRGATDPHAAILWNQAYEHITKDVDVAPSRLWDWSDLPFLRGIRRPMLLTSFSAIYTEFKPDRPQLTIRLILSNDGDQDMYWEVDTPQRIHLLSGEENGRVLHGMSSVELTFSVDFTGYNFAEFHDKVSLGGILVQVYDAEHHLIHNETRVIPVSISIVSPPVQQIELYNYKIHLPIVIKGNEQWDLYFPPADILVNGQTQLKTDSLITAVYGEGWYDLERNGDDYWRWAQTPAKLYLCAPSPQTVSIEAPVISLPPLFPEGGQFSLTINEQENQNLMVQQGEQLHTTIKLRAGWNIISISSSLGNFQPSEILALGNADTRQLGFALGMFDIKTKQSTNDRSSGVCLLPTTKYTAPQMPYP